MKATSIFLWPNGMVIAFDEKGEQMVEQQGRVFDALYALKPFCDKDTKFWFCLPEEGKLESLAWNWMFEEAEG